MGAFHLTLLTWPDYISPATLDQFGIETGSSVNLEVVPSAVELVERVRRGPPVDLLCPPDYAVKELAAEGRLLALDRHRLPNSSNHAPEFAGNRPHDPRNLYTVPKDWGTTGYMIRRDCVPDPAHSWADFWKLANRYTGRITVLDSPGEIIGAALKMRGRSYNAGDADAMGQVRTDLAALRPHLLTFATDYRPLLTSGEAWISLGWNGEAATLSRLGVSIEYVLPDEGSQIWEDDWAIAAESSHPEEAHAFLDFILRADVACQEALYTGYATPNLPAWRILPEAIRTDPAIYPPPEVRARLEYGQPISPAGAGMRDAVWRSFRD